MTSVDARLSQVDAIADTQQLIQLLTESHPDPYTRTGGPIAFHRRAEEIVSTVPEDGITRDDLLHRLRPLVAGLHDGHTLLFPPGSEPDAVPEEGRPLLPLDFDPIEGQLVIGAVYREEDRPYLGARLRSVNGVGFEELARRMERLRGADNRYNNLVHLADALADPSLVVPLLDSRGEEGLTLELLASHGATSQVTIPFIAGPLGDPIEPASEIELPPLAPSDIGWGFLDEDRSVACLRIASLVRYREAFEINREIGHGRFIETYLADVVDEATGGALPDDLDRAIATVPSAAEQLLELFTAMREALTETLLVDLRDNGGGNSFFATILAYFLDGIEGAIDLDTGYQVLRYSPLYLANYLSPPEDRRIAIEASLGNGGYDFSQEREWRRRRSEGLTGTERARAIADAEAEVARAPSFSAIVERGEGEGAWSPRIVVLTSARTYSAGFDVAAMLVKRGARLIGVPSSQAGNCFIDGLFFTLDHSGLTGIISHKWGLLFPDEPERGTLLEPDVELSYEYLASCDFDPNAAVRLALEDLRGER